MKKLYYIANVRMPTERAHGIQIVKMCEAFANVGAEVGLVVPKKITLIKEDTYRYYNVRENFKISRSWCLNTARFGKIGYRLETLSFAIVVALWSLFKDGLFYTRDECPAFFLKLFGKKVYWEAHMGQQNIFVKGLVRLNVDIVAISRGLKKFYLGWGIKDGSILVAPDAINLEEFNVRETREEARRKLNLPITGKIAMYIGRLDEWKGYRTVLEASRLMPKDEVTFVVIGGSEKHNQELAARYPTVIFIDFRPYSELPVNQKAADILLIPNSGATALSNYYTSPMKLFAYMASGVPILSSDLPSLREVLDESSSFFFTPDDSESLVKEIRHILAHSDDAELKARKAEQEVLNYTWDDRAEKVLKFIK